MSETQQKVALYRRVWRNLFFKVLNPVFMKLSSPFRTLPDFIVIGEHKCGTTFLYDCIAEHPDVAKQEEKELYFFDRSFANGLSHYKCHFPTCFSRRRHLRKTGHQLQVGEATPSYFTHPLVPKRLRKAVPHAKLILILRNPVDRTYSHYQMHHRRGRETETFEEALRLESERIAGEKERILAEKPGSHKSHLQQQGYTYRGRYVEHLDHWLKEYDPQQILVLCSEQTFAEPTQQLARVYEFLDLAPPYPSFESKSALNRGTYDSMLPQTRAELERTFKPLNLQLYERLGWDPVWDQA